MDLSPCSPAGRRRGRPALALATAALTVGLLVLPACESSAGASTFQRESVAVRPTDSFVESAHTNQQAATPPANVKAVAYSAKIPGLYGSSATGTDAASLVQGLTADQAKAKAWANILGIDPADIATYVAKLTPVVLRTDTAITSHTYVDGNATSTPVVLQAGTEVLVDDHGVPVVRSEGGNPLTAPPSTKDAKFTGAAWKGFTADSVTTVAATPKPVDQLVLADPGGKGVVRPVGTTGGTDTPFDPAVLADAGKQPAGTAAGAGNGNTSSVDPASPASDTGTDGGSPAENPDATTTTTGPALPVVTLNGTLVADAGCFGAPPSTPISVQVGGTEGHPTITLPSSTEPGFAGLVFDVNPDGSIDGELSNSPAGAPGLTVNYRFQGQLTRNDPPTPWTLTGTLTTSGVGTTCNVQYNVSGQAAPTPASSAPTTQGPSVTTYVATYGMAGSTDAPGGAVTNDCARARFLDYPFSITVRVREGVDGGEARVVGQGGESGVDVSLYAPAPTRDLRGGLTNGEFSVGGHNTYHDFYDGTFTAHWSGGVGARRTRPAQFPLTITENWNRDRGFVDWLTDSGGPDDFTCSYTVTAVRQA